MGGIDLSRTRELRTDCGHPCTDRQAEGGRHGTTLADSANTIVVVGRSTPRTYAACVVLADLKLDVNGTAKRRLGTRKASFATAGETQQLTGIESAV